MVHTSFKVDKNLYSFTCLQSAVLSFPECGIQIENSPDSWNVSFISSDNTVSENSFSRALNEYALRESLEKKFHAEREAIYKLTFEKD